MKPQIALCCAILMALAPITSPAADAPLPTVESVDLSRYAGAWYEIALLPNRFQKQCVADTQANYRPAGDRVEVINRCRMASGEVDQAKGYAKTIEGSQNARLKVTFFWPFYGDYWVLDLDPEYRHVLIGTPSRKFAWVLSRTPQMDEATLNRLLERAQALGFKREDFQRTPQTRPLD
jgi:apolipoprotein D and lipocalin family protein